MLSGISPFKKATLVDLKAKKDSTTLGHYVQGLLPGISGKSGEFFPKVDTFLDIFGGKADTSYSAGVFQNFKKGQIKSVVQPKTQGVAERLTNELTVAFRNSNSAAQFIAKVQISYALLCAKMDMTRPPLDADEVALLGNAMSLAIHNSGGMEAFPAVHWVELFPPGQDSGGRSLITKHSTLFAPVFGDLIALGGVRALAQFQTKFGTAQITKGLKEAFATRQWGFAGGRNPVDRFLFYKYFSVSKNPVFDSEGSTESIDPFCLKYPSSHIVNLSPNERSSLSDVFDQNFPKFETKGDLPKLEDAPWRKFFPDKNISRGYAVLEYYLVELNNYLADPEGTVDFNFRSFDLIRRNFKGFFDGVVLPYLSDLDFSKKLGLVLDFKKQAQILTEMTRLLPQNTSAPEHREFAASLVKRAIALQNTQGVGSSVQSQMTMVVETVLASLKINNQENRKAAAGALEHVDLTHYSETSPVRFLRITGYEKFNTQEHLPLGVAFESFERFLIDPSSSYYGQKERLQESKDSSTKKRLSWKERRKSSQEKRRSTNSKKSEDSKQSQSSSKESQQSENSKVSQKRSSESKSSSKESKQSENAKKSQQDVQTGGKLVDTTEFSSLTRTGSQPDLRKEFSAKESGTTDSQSTMSSSLSESRVTKPKRPKSRNNLGKDYVFTLAKVKKAASEQSSWGVVTRQVVHWLADLHQFIAEKEKGAHALTLIGAVDDIPQDHKEIVDLLDQFKMHVAKKDRDKVQNLADQIKTRIGEIAKTVLGNSFDPSEFGSLKLQKYGFDAVFEKLEKDPKKMTLEEGASVVKYLRFRQLEQLHSVAQKFFDAADTYKPEDHVPKVPGSEPVPGKLRSTETDLISAGRSNVVDSINPSIVREKKQVFLQGEQEGSSVAYEEVLDRQFGSRGYQRFLDQNQLVDSPLPESVKLYFFYRQQFDFDLVPTIKLDPNSTTHNEEKKKADVLRMKQLARSKALEYTLRAAGDMDAIESSRHLASETPEFDYFKSKLESVISFWLFGLFKHYEGEDCPFDYPDIASFEKTFQDIQQFVSELKESDLETFSTSSNHKDITVDVGMRLGPEKHKVLLKLLLEHVPREKLGNLPKVDTSVSLAQFRTLTDRASKLEDVVVPPVKKGPTVEVALRDRLTTLLTGAVSQKPSSTTTDEFDQFLSEYGLDTASSNYSPVVAQSAGQVVLAAFVNWIEATFGTVDAIKYPTGEGLDNVSSDPSFGYQWTIILGLKTPQNVARFRTLVETLLKTVNWTPALAQQFKTLSSVIIDKDPPVDFGVKPQNTDKDWYKPARWALGSGNQKDFVGYSWKKTQVSYDQVLFRNILRFPSDFKSLLDQDTDSFRIIFESWVVKGVEDVVPGIVKSLSPSEFVNFTILLAQWVKNYPNGNVFAQFEGAEARLHDVIYDWVDAFSALTLKPPIKQEDVETILAFVNRLRDFGGVRNKSPNYVVAGMMNATQGTIKQFNGKAFKEVWTQASQSITDNVLDNISEQQSVEPEIQVEKANKIKVAFAKRRLDKELQKLNGYVSVIRMVNDLFRLNYPDLTEKLSAQTDWETFIKDNKGLETNIADDLAGVIESVREQLKLLNKDTLTVAALNILIKKVQETIKTYKLATHFPGESEDWKNRLTREMVNCRGYIYNRLKKEDPFLDGQKPIDLLNDIQRGLTDFRVMDILASSIGEQHSFTVEMLYGFMTDLAEFATISRDIELLDPRYEYLSPHYGFKPPENNQKPFLNWEQSPRFQKLNTQEMWTKYVHLMKRYTALVGQLDLKDSPLRLALDAFKKQDKVVGELYINKKAMSHIYKGIETAPNLDQYLNDVGLPAIVQQGELAAQKLRLAKQEMDQVPFLDSKSRGAYQAKQTKVALYTKFVDAYLASVVQLLENIFKVQPGWFDNSNGTPVKLLINSFEKCVGQLTVDQRNSLIFELEDPEDSHDVFADLKQFVVDQLQQEAKPTLQKPSTGELVLTPNRNNKRTAQKWHLQNYKNTILDGLKQFGEVNNLETRVRVYEYLHQRKAGFEFEPEDRKAHVENLGEDNFDALMGWIDEKLEEVVNPHFEATEHFVEPDNADEYFDVLRQLSTHCSDTSLRHNLAPALCDFIKKYDPTCEFVEDILDDTTGLFDESPLAVAQILSQLARAIRESGQSGMTPVIDYIRAAYLKFIEKLETGFNETALKNDRVARIAIELVEVTALFSDRDEPYVDPKISVLMTAIEEDLKDLGSKSTESVAAQIQFLKRVNQLSDFVKELRSDLAQLLLGELELGRPGEIKSFQDLRKFMVLYDQDPSSSDLAILKDAFSPNGWVKTSKYFESAPFFEKAQFFAFARHWLKTHQLEQSEIGTVLRQLIVDDTMRFVLAFQPESSSDGLIKVPELSLDVPVMKTISKFDMVPSFAKFWYVGVCRDLVWSMQQGQKGGLINGSQLASIKSFMGKHLVDLAGAFDIENDPVFTDYPGYKPLFKYYLGAALDFRLDLAIEDGFLIALGFKPEEAQDLKEKMRQAIQQSVDFSDIKEIAPDPKQVNWSAIKHGPHKAMMLLRGFLYRIEEDMDLSETEAGQSPWDDEDFKAYFPVLKDALATLVERRPTSSDAITLIGNVFSDLISAFQLRDGKSKWPVSFQQEGLADVLNYFIVQASHAIASRVSQGLDEESFVLDLRDEAMLQEWGAELKSMVLAQFLMTSPKSVCLGGMDNVFGKFLPKPGDQFGMLEYAAQLYVSGVNQPFAQQNLTLMIEKAQDTILAVKSTEEEIAKQEWIQAFNYLVRIREILDVLDRDNPIFEVVDKAFEDLMLKADREIDESDPNIDRDWYRLTQVVDGWDAKAFNAYSTYGISKLTDGLVAIQTVASGLQDFEDYIAKIFLSGSLQQPGVIYQFVAHYIRTLVDHVKSTDVDFLGVQDAVYQTLIEQMLDNDWFAVDMTYFGFTDRNKKLHALIGMLEEVDREDGQYGFDAVDALIKKLENLMHKDQEVDVMMEDVLKVVKQKQDVFKRQVESGYYESLVQKARVKLAYEKRPLVSDTQENLMKWAVAQLVLVQGWKTEAEDEAYKIDSTEDSKKPFELAKLFEGLQVEVFQDFRFSFPQLIALYNQVLQHPDLATNDVVKGVQQFVWDQVIKQLSQLSPLEQSRILETCGDFKTTWPHFATEGSLSQTYAVELLEKNNIKLGDAIPDIKQGKDAVDMGLVRLMVLLTTDTSPRAALESWVMVGSNDWNAVDQSWFAGWTVSEVKAFLDRMDSLGMGPAQVRDLLLPYALNQLDEQDSFEAKCAILGPCNAYFDHWPDAFKKAVATMLRDQMSQVFAGQENKKLRLFPESVVPHIPQLTTFLTDHIFAGGLATLDAGQLEIDTTIQNGIATILFRLEMWGDGKPNNELNIKVTGGQTPGAPSVDKYLEKLKKDSGFWPYVNVRNYRDNDRHRVNVARENILQPLEDAIKNFDLAIAPFAKSIDSKQDLLDVVARHPQVFYAVLMELLKQTNTFFNAGYDNGSILAGIHVIAIDCLTAIKLNAVDKPNRNPYTALMRTALFSPELELKTVFESQLSSPDSTLRKIVSELGKFDNAVQWKTLKSGQQVKYEQAAILIGVYDAALGWLAQNRNHANRHSVLGLVEAVELFFQKTRLLPYDAKRQFKPFRPTKEMSSSDRKRLQGANTYLELEQKAHEKQFGHFATLLRQLRAVLVDPRGRDVSAMSRTFRDVLKGMFAKDKDFSEIARIIDEASDEELTYLNLDHMKLDNQYYKSDLKSAIQQIPFLKFYPILDKPEFFQTFYKLFADHLQTLSLKLEDLEGANQIFVPKMLRAVPPAYRQLVWQALSDFGDVNSPEDLAKVLFERLEKGSFLKGKYPLYPFGAFFEMMPQKFLAGKYPTLDNGLSPSVEDNMVKLAVDMSKLVSAHMEKTIGSNVYTYLENEDANLCEMLVFFSKSELFELCKAQDFRLELEASYYQGCVMARFSELLSGEENCALSRAGVFKVGNTTIEDLQSMEQIPDKIKVQWLHALKETLKADFKSFVQRELKPQVINFKSRTAIFEGFSNQIGKKLQPMSIVRCAMAYLTENINSSGVAENLADTQKVAVFKRLLRQKMIECQFSQSHLNLVSEGKISPTNLRKIKQEWFDKEARNRVVALFKRFDPNRMKYAIRYARFVVQLMQAGGVDKKSEIINSSWCNGMCFCPGNGLFETGFMGRKSFDNDYGGTIINALVQLGLKGELEDFVGKIDGSFWAQTDIGKCFDKPLELTDTRNLKPVKPSQQSVEQSVDSTPKPQVNEDEKKEQYTDMDELSVVEQKPLVKKPVQKKVQQGSEGGAETTDTFELIHQVEQIQTESGLIPPDRPYESVAAYLAQHPILPSDVDEMNDVFLDEYATKTSTKDRKAHATYKNLIELFYQGLGRSATALFSSYQFLKMESTDTGEVRVRLSGYYYKVAWAEYYFPDYRLDTHFIDRNIRKKLKSKNIRFLSTKHHTKAHTQILFEGLSLVTRARQSADVSELVDLLVLCDKLGQDNGKEQGDLDKFINGVKVEINQLLVTRLGDQINSVKKSETDWKTLALSLQSLTQRYKNNEALQKSLLRMVVKGVNELVKTMVPEQIAILYPFYKAIDQLKMPDLIRRFEVSIRDRSIDSETLLWIRVIVERIEGLEETHKKTLNLSLNALLMQQRIEAEDSLDRLLNLDGFDIEVNFLDLVPEDQRNVFDYSVVMQTGKVQVDDNPLELLRYLHRQKFVALALKQIQRQKTLTGQITAAKLISDKLKLVPKELQALYKEALWEALASAVSVLPEGFMTDSNAVEAYQAFKELTWDWLFSPQLEALKTLNCALSKLTQEQFKTLNGNCQSLVLSPALARKLKLLNEDNYATATFNPDEVQELRDKLSTNGVKDTKVQTALKVVGTRLVSSAEQLEPDYWQKQGFGDNISLVNRKGIPAFGQEIVKWLLGSYFTGQLDLDSVVLAEKRDLFIEQTDRGFESFLKQFAPGQRPQFMSKETQLGIINLDEEKWEFRQVLGNCFACFSRERGVLLQKHRKSIDDINHQRKLFKLRFLGDVKKSNHILSKIDTVIPDSGVSEGKLKLLTVFDSQSGQAIDGHQIFRQWVDLQSEFQQVNSQYSSQKVGVDGFAPLVDGLVRFERLKAQAMRFDQLVLERMKQLKAEVLHRQQEIHQKYQAFYGDTKADSVDLLEYQEAYEQETESFDPNAIGTESFIPKTESSQQGISDTRLVGMSVWDYFRPFRNYLDVLEFAESRLEHDKQRLEEGRKAMLVNIAALKQGEEHWKTNMPGTQVTFEAYFEGEIKSLLDPPKKGVRHQRRSSLTVTSSFDSLTPVLHRTTSLGSMELDPSIARWVLKKDKTPGQLLKALTVFNEKAGIQLKNKPGLLLGLRKLGRFLETDAMRTNSTVDGLWKGNGSTLYSKGTVKLKVQEDFDDAYRKYRDEDGTFEEVSNIIEGVNAKAQKVQDIQSRMQTALKDMLGKDGFFRRLKDPSVQQQFQDCLDVLQGKEAPFVKASGARKDGVIPQILSALTPLAQTLSQLKVAGWWKVGKRDVEKMVGPLFELLTCISEFNDLYKTSGAPEGLQHRGRPVGGYLLGAYRSIANKMVEVCATASTDGLTVSQSDLLIHSMIRSGAPLALVKTFIENLTKKDEEIAKNWADGFIPYGFNAKALTDFRQKVQKSCQDKSNRPDLLLVGSFVTALPTYQTYVQPHVDGLRQADEPLKDKKYNGLKGLYQDKSGIRVPLPSFLSMVNTMVLQLMSDERDKNINGLLQVIYQAGSNGVETEFKTLFVNLMAVLRELDSSVSKTVYADLNKKVGPLLGSDFSEESCLPVFREIILALVNEKSVPVLLKPILANFSKVYFEAPSKDFQTNSAHQHNLFSSVFDYYVGKIPNPDSGELTKVKQALVGGEKSGYYGYLDWAEGRLLAGYDEIFGKEKDTLMFKEGGIKLSGAKKHGLNKIHFYQMFEAPFRVLKRQPDNVVGEKSRQKLYELPTILDQAEIEELEWYPRIKKAMEKPVEIDYTAVNRNITGTIGDIENIAKEIYTTEVSYSRDMVELHNRFLVLNSYAKKEGEYSKIAELAKKYRVPLDDVAHYILSFAEYGEMLTYDPPEKNAKYDNYKQAFSGVLDTQKMMVALSGLGVVAPYYTRYVPLYNRILAFMTELQTHFKDSKSEAGVEINRVLNPTNGKGIFDMMIMPVQRMPRYVLFLKDLADKVGRKAGDKETAKGFQEILVGVEQIATSINEVNRAAPLLKTIPSYDPAPTKDGSVFQRQLKEWLAKMNNRHGFTI